MADSVSYRYEIPQEVKFLSETWNDETVLFDPRSGDTHLLNAMAAAAMDKLKEQASDSRHLTLRLAKQFETSPNESFIGQVDTLLEQLVELGLAESSGR